MKRPQDVPASIPFLSALLAAIWLVGTGGHSLHACPICLGVTPQKPTLAEEYQRARDVVVARVAGDAKNCKIERVIKGESALVGQTATLTTGLGVKGRVLLSRESEDSPWQFQGATALHLWVFLKFVENLPVAKPKTDDEWLQHLARWRRYLGHADPRLARSAWSEWAGASYKILRQARFEPAKLRTWMADPSQAYARPMWIILLGVSGGEEDADSVRKQLETAWSKNDAILLPSLLTARIEKEGEAGIQWLEERYIRNRDRTLEEIKSAMTALSVQGTANEKLRPRILAAYRTLLHERRPLSGLAARDLAAWKDWSATDHYQTLLASGKPVLPETRRAILDYLESSKEVPHSESD